MPADNPFSPAPGNRAQPDIDPLTADIFGAPADDKVELDLDDAPFLLPDPSEEIPAPSTAPIALDADTAKPASAALSSRKRLLFGGIGGLLLLALVALGWFFYTPAAQPPDEPKKVVVSETAPPVPAKPGPTILSFEPFWVEQRDSRGDIRFLVCTFSASIENPKLVMEARGKKVVIRDAVYYYLKNKTLLFLTDGANAESLKKDLLNIINGYLSLGKLEDLLIENYLVK